MNLRDELDVYVEVDGTSILAGRLRASFGAGRTLGGTTFTYDRDYFRSPGAYELDPKLTRSRAPHRAGEDQLLFGAFQDLTPDDWGRRVIDASLALARQARAEIPGRVGEFDYLALAADETRLGALRFRDPSAGEWLGPAHIPELSALGLDAVAAAAARLEAHDATEADLELLGAPGTSAGGARPKVSVYIDGELRLVKLPSERDGGRDGEAWEFVAMTLARTAGIHVQEGTLLRTSDGKSTLALRRFDRTPSGGRIGFMSARTALEIGDQEHGQFTYEDLADVTDHLTHGEAAQLRDLFKRVALNVLITNTDDHWKNHAFLRGGGAWQLSPAYDLNPSHAGGALVARPISARDDPRNRDIRNLIATAGTYRLTAAVAGAALAEVADAVEAWPEVAQAAGISAPEIRSMARSFPEDQRAHARAAASGESQVHVDVGAPRARQSLASSSVPSAVWVAPHMRNGRQVAGFWRRREER
ncbi:HIPA PROTEIN [Leucobacter sp. 7(1)]|uniref:type II toxin-antitoxin system HipA family toxin n=1 Tax=Leucobacter sp. 7(1) TaxID=1255613 RepID=UPI00097F63A0|nr:HipA domain-containing protein [Leucobacter sp. 7(1)]SJN10331.1 HIPA PROTEIN [Leucobacter sp. 7(1)]